MYMAAIDYLDKTYMNRSLLPSEITFSLDFWMFSVLFLGKCKSLVERFTEGV